MTEALTSGLLRDAEALYEKLAIKMSNELATRYLQFLARLNSMQKNGAGVVHQENIDALAADMAAVLKGISDEQLWEAAQAVAREAQRFSTVTPEIHEWARQYSDEEICAGLREIEET